MATFAAGVPNMGDLWARVQDAVRRPWPDNAGWVNVFLIVGFVMLALVAWRQVVNYIGVKGE